MTPTRYDVLEQLAATSASDTQSTTTVKALAAALEADERSVATRVAALEACELAQTQPDGRVRVTITGEELLELGADELVVVDAEQPGE